MGEKENELIAVQAYRMDNLEKKVTELCEKISDLLEKLPEKYQTKEMCASMVGGCKERNEEKFENLQNELSDIKAKSDRLLWGGLCGLLYILWDLLKPVLTK